MAIDSGQIPFLLRLIDDESDEVRKAASEALASFGPALEEELKQYPDTIDESLAGIISNIMKPHRSSKSTGLTDVPERPFKPGTLVKHKRYGYRGVVVAFDESCEADEAWYLTNQTQPDRDQPWYHVLVHESEQVTYAAQTSLEPDQSTEEVDHPLVAHFFSDFQNGKYTRNETPWPEA